MIVISCYANFKVHSTVLVKNNTAISQEKIHTTQLLHYLIHNLFVNIVNFSRQL